MQQLPQQDEFQAWLEHPLTVLFRQWVVKHQKNLQDAWANGQYLDVSSPHEFTIRNAGAIGEHQFGARILNLDYDTFVGDMTNE